jgi:protein-tyrosine phosphatase
MAEFILKDMVKKRGIEDKFFIASAATSSEEIGNGVHYGTRKILEGLGIDSSGKRAVRLEKSDSDKYDFFIGMDEYNVKNMSKILGKGNIVKLLDFTPNPRAIADPWYTGNFDETYEDVLNGCEGFLKYLEREHMI